MKLIQGIFGATEPMKIKAFSFCISICGQKCFLLMNYKFSLDKSTGCGYHFSVLKYCTFYSLDIESSLAVKE